MVHCGCGNEKLIPTSKWRHGGLVSCGCVRDRLKKGFGASRQLPLGQAARNVWFSQNRRWAERRGLAFELSFEQFIDLCERPCHYCGVEDSIDYGSGRYNGSFVCNGVDRVDNDLGYRPDNCVPCCFICNRAKNTMTAFEFREWVERVFHHLNPTANQEFPDRAQRFAVCNRQAERRGDPKTDK